MKAIVMAGGEGTRLRPLTEGRPKPMVELLGRPVLERTVELLKANGVRDICFTLRYLPGQIRDWFGDGEKFGVRITHRVESEPLGTAGGVRACRDFIGDEEALILSGDAVCNFDLRLLLEFYQKRKAEAVIALFEHAEPTRFGLVIAEPDGRVTAFSEKPSWDRVITGMVNTGIYILSPEVVEMIPEGKPYDFGKELFPRLLREGRRLYATPARSYWCDIGSPEAYRRCCVDAVAGRIGIDLKAPEIGPGVFSNVPLDGVKLTAPVYVGEGCSVEAGAELGPNAVLSQGSHVGKDSRIRDSVINGAWVDRGCVVDGAVVGRDARIGAGAGVARECVVGDGARIGDNCVLAPGVRIWTDRHVAAGRRVSRSITGETPAEPAKFTSDSTLRGSLGTSMTPETALSLGAELGKNARVGVACTGGNGARLMADALMCGVTASGGEAVRLDAGFEAQLAGVSGLFALSAAAFVRQAGEEITVTFLTGAGTAIGTERRRKLEAVITGERPRQAPETGGVSNVSGAARAYISGIVETVRKAVGTPSHVTVAVTGRDAENRTLRCVLAGLGFTVGKVRPGTASFSLLPGGFAFEARDERGRELDIRHGLAAAALAAMRLKLSPLAAPRELPAAAERLAARYGCTLVPAQSDGWEKLWEKQRWLRDGAVSVALIASVMAGEKTELAALYDDLPPFETAERRVELSLSRARAMELLRAESAETAAELSGGLALTTSRGRVRFAPTFDGGAMRVQAEAVNRETADELACGAEALMRSLEKREGTGRA